MNNKKPKIVSNLWRQYGKSWVRWELRDERGGEEYLSSIYQETGNVVGYMHYYFINP